MILRKVLCALIYVFYISVGYGQNPVMISKDSYKVSSLGPQLANVALQGSIFAEDPDGRLLIYTVTRGTPAHLVAFDVSTQQLIVDIPLPQVDGSWDLEVSSTGTVYIAGGAGGHLYKHEPGSGAAENLGKVLGTENYIWDLAAGENGEIYGATYPNCKVFRYHPDEGYTDFGKGALVQDENYVRGLAYSHAAQKVYAGIGAHAHLIELDVNSKIKKDILPSKYSSSKFVYDIGHVQNLKSGDRIYLMLSGGESHNTLVYNLTTGEYEEEIPVFYVKTIIKDPNSQKVFYVEKTKLMMIDYAANKPAPMKVADFRGKPLASTWNEKGELLFLNSHQQLVTFEPKTSRMQFQTLEVPPQPISLTHIGMGPDNKIWSGGYLSGNNAAFDLQSNSAVVYKGLSQTESAVTLGTKIYFGNYPGAKFNVYDTSSEWNIKEKNPKLIGSVKGQDRPFGALAVPELNKIFFGTVPDYGNNGGQLVEINALTDEITSQKSVVDNQSIITLAYQDEMLIGGCSIWGGLGVQPIEKEAKLFVWDPVSRQKVFEVVPVPGAKAITVLMNGPDGYIWGYAAGTLFKFDVKNRRILMTKKIYDDKRNSFLWRPDALVVHPNGMIYGDLVGRVVSLDPNTLELKLFGISGANVILGPTRELYYRSGKEIYRLDIFEK